MAKPGHVPGDWRIGDGSAAAMSIPIYVEINGEQSIICRVNWLDGFDAGEHGAYNARLIAAAPKLLEACEAFAAASLSLDDLSAAARMCAAAFACARDGLPSVQSKPQPKKKGTR